MITSSRTYNYLMPGLNCPSPDRLASLETSPTIRLPVNMTIPGQYRSSTAYITGPLQCVSNGPITFCTSFPYRPDTCSRYWPGNGPLQYGTGPVSLHTVPGQYRTGTVTLYRFSTGPIPYRYRYTVPFHYWPNNISYLMAHYSEVLVWYQ